MSSHVIGIVMSRAFASIVAHRHRWSMGLLLAAGVLLTSGFSSCAGATGPLLAPLQITPNVVLLRASIEAKADAIGLARIDGGSGRDRYQATVEYLTKDGSGWLTVEFAGNDVTLRAAPGGLAPGIFIAKVTIDDTREGTAGTLQVEFQVTP
jgi:hypothetical protein